MSTKTGWSTPKKTLIFVSVLLTTVGLYWKYTQHTVEPKKKIIILSSIGGGGHTAATKALRGYLDQDYDVKAVQAFSEVLQQKDPIALLTKGAHNSVEFYNYITYKRWFPILMFMRNAGRWYFDTYPGHVEQLIYSYLEQKKPDLVISVIPMINNMILKAAKELDIPFLLVPTDFDYTAYIANISGKTYDKFYLTTPFGSDLSKSQKVHQNLPILKENLILSRIPIRAGFFAEKNHSKIKKMFSIPENKPVVLVMMGAQGSREMYILAKRLRTIETPAHFVLCLGRNKSLQKKINKIYFPNHLSVTALGFTDKIPELMAISDFIITKPGPNTISEAMQMNLPIILDKSATPLEWEKPNFELVKKYNIGMTANSIDEMVFFANDLLKYPRRLQAFKKDLEQLPKVNGALKVKETVDRIFGKKAKK